MAEIPEIAKYCRQMHETLRGKEIADVQLLQPKCSSLSPAELCSALCGRTVERVYNRGKWIMTSLSGGMTLLLSLGMGADILYCPPGGEKPAKYMLDVQFTDGSAYTVRFWWFGYVEACPDSKLADEPRTGKIGIDPLDPAFTVEHLIKIMAGKKTGIKSFLLDQKNIGGIGNMYMHDILFKCGLHPKRKISDMTEADIRRLHKSMGEIFDLSCSLGTADYEMDFFGQKGNYSKDHFFVGYKEGEPCPSCGTEIAFLKTGSTGSYLCPSCQK